MYSLGFPVMYTVHCRKRDRPTPSAHGSHGHADPLPFSLGTRDRGAKVRALVLRSRLAPIPSFLYGYRHSEVQPCSLRRQWDQLPCSEPAGLEPSCGGDRAISSCTVVPFSP